MSWGLENRVASIRLIGPPVSSPLAYILTCTSDSICKGNSTRNPCSWCRYAPSLLGWCPLITLSHEIVGCSSCARISRDTEKASDPCSPSCDFYASRLERWKTSQNVGICHRKVHGEIKFGKRSVWRRFCRSFWRNPATWTPSIWRGYYELGIGKVSRASMKKLDGVYQFWILSLNFICIC